METGILVRSVAVFLFFAVILAMNLGDNLLARLGMAENYGLMFGLSILFTLLLVGRNTYVIAVTVCLCLVANMPADFGLNFGLDRDYYAGIMLALMMQPVMARLID